MQIPLSRSFSVPWPVSLPLIKSVYDKGCASPRVVHDFRALQGYFMTDTNSPKTARLMRRYSSKSVITFLGAIPCKYEGTR